MKILYFVVIPVKAGIQSNYMELLTFRWIPAFAGMTTVRVAGWYIHVQ